MDTKINIAKKIRRLREARGFTQAQLGILAFGYTKEESGASQNKIKKIENANVNFNIDEIQSIAVALGVPFEELIGIVPISERYFERQVSEFTFIPMYKLKLSGGSGTYTDVHDTLTEDNYAFRTSWLKTRCERNCCKLFLVNGDSMYPLICTGDIVLVDSSKKDIIDDKVYAFADDSTIKIKRLRKEGSRIKWYGDNKHLEENYGYIIDNFYMIGRVIWVGHELK